MNTRWPPWPWPTGDYQVSSSQWIPDDHHDQQVTIIITMITRTRWQPSSPWSQGQGGNHHHHDHQVATIITMTTRWQPSSPWPPGGNHHHHDHQVATINTMTTRWLPSSPWSSGGDHHHHDHQVATIITMTTRWVKRSQISPAAAAGRPWRSAAGGWGGQAGWCPAPHWPSRCLAPQAARWKTPAPQRVGNCAFVPSGWLSIYWLGLRHRWHTPLALKRVCLWFILRV